MASGSPPLAGEERGLTAGLADAEQHQDEMERKEEVAEAEQEEADGTARAVELRDLKVSEKAAGIVASVRPCEMPAKREHGDDERAAVGHGHEVQLK